MFAQFLAKDSVFGIGFDNQVADRLFGLAVGAGDGLLGAGRGRLVLDLVVGAEMGNDHGARRVRQASAEGEELVEPFGIVGHGWLSAHSDKQTGRAQGTPRCFTLQCGRDYQIATGLPFAPVAPRIGDGAKKYANS